MNSTSPETCVFVTTCGRDSIRLIDAYTGLTRATYRSFDHLERLAVAHSVSFSPDGSRIYAGYKGMIRMYWTAVPGTSCDEVSFYGMHVTVELLSLSSPKSLTRSFARLKQRRKADREASSPVSASIPGTGKCSQWHLFPGRYQFPANQRTMPFVSWKDSGVESRISLFLRTEIACSAAVAGYVIR